MFGFGTICLIRRIRSSRHLSQISDRKFLQVPTTFAFWSFADVDKCGSGLLGSPEHEKCRLDGSGASPGSRAFARSLTIFSRATEKPKRRALFIGINDYPDPANQLDGCVNDTFLDEFIASRARI